MYLLKMQIRIRSLQNLGMRPEAMLTLLFLASRVWLVCRGIHTQMFFLAAGWQLLDPKLLEENLASSLFYMHAQPPLWNGVVGVLLKLATGNSDLLLLLFTLLSWGMSLAITLIIYSLVLRIGNNKLIAAGSAAFYVLFSASYFYENFLGYPLLTAFAICLCALGAYQSAITPSNTAKFWWLTLTFFSLASLSWIWGLFHPLLIPLIAGMLFYVQQFRNDSKSAKARYLIAAALATVLAFSVPLKNLILYNTFSASSWMGINLMALVQSANPGLRSDIYCDYHNEFSLREKELGAKGAFPQALEQPVNNLQYKTGGYLNQNHIGIIGRNKLCLDGARRYYLAAPIRLARNRLQALIVSSTRLSDHNFIRPVGLEDGSENLSLINARNNIYLPVPWRDGQRLFLAPALAIGSIFLWLPLQWYRLRRRGLLPLGWSSLLAVSLLLVLWLLVVGHLANAGEQERFRFSVEPLMITILSVGFALSLRAPARVAASTYTNPDHCD